MGKSFDQVFRGNAGSGGSGPNVTEVFSTHMYTGTGSSLVINNGIDLSTEGGMTWIKNREASDPHVLTDTARGATKRLASDSNAAEATDTDTLTSFNSNGFTVGGDVKVNTSNEEYVSWTFRKAPGFFDVVTYSGNEVNGRAISHNLGVKPSSIWIKCRNSAEDFACWYQALHSTGNMLRLNQPDTSDGFDSRYHDEPTDSVFYVGTDNQVNASGGKTYVAYLFAGAAGDGAFGDDGDQDIIRIGSYVGNGATPAGPVVNVGFEPQWLLIKKVTDASAPWYIYDTMRGWPVSSTASPHSITTLLRPNTTDSEVGGTWASNNLSKTGFQIRDDDAHFNTADQTYIYMAIRTDMITTPTDATKLFDVNTYNGDGQNSIEISVSTRPDLLILKSRNNAYGNVWSVHDRLRGAGRELRTNVATVEYDSYDKIEELGNDHYELGGTNSYNEGSSTFMNYVWTRAKGFFDIVAYTGTGSARTIAHSLGVAPEMMWVKARGRLLVLMMLGIGMIQRLQTQYLVLVLTMLLILLVLAS